ncbi:MAG: type II toxin-antitoxin system VapC family toxin [Chloroflexi bacterium]|nr:type II toxin-antitoxin system VapC family toxin [Chloroflexota bacterium]
MITAVDTNVLLDILVPGAPQGQQSELALAEALRTGATIISEAVFSELSAHFGALEDLNQLLTETGIRLQPSGPGTLFLAGKTWREYLVRRPAGLACPTCGTTLDIRCPGCGASLHPRGHVIADFLIGAHAIVHADRLLSRDRGYFATYFPQLRLA